MVKYFLKRLGLMLITFFIIVYLFFLFVRLLPDGYQPSLSGDDTQYWLQFYREGRDKPITVQFFIWIGNIFKYKSFGFSNILKREVGEYMFEKIPTTIIFQLIPYLISVPLGIMLGVAAALHKNKWPDHLISVLIMVFISIPTFVLAVLGQLIFGWKLGWAPRPPYVAATTQFKANFWFGMWSYMLPAFIMILGGIPGWARSIRAELTEQMTQDYMLLARSKGLSKRQAVYRHALKNAMVPFAPSIFLGFTALMSGSVIMEEIFRVDGVGKIYLFAFNHRDMPLLLLYIVFYNFIGLITSILADLSYTLLDPRVRVGSGK